MADEVLVKKTIDGEKIAQYSVHVFSADNFDLLPAIWTSQEIDFAENPEFQIRAHENPTVGLINGQSIYLGTDNGAVYELNGDKKVHKRFPRFRELQQGDHHSPRSDAVNMFFNGWRKTRALVAHNGEVYDASSQGLFKTNTDVVVDERFITHAFVHNGKLLMVPVGFRLERQREMDFADRFAQSQAGCLIDVETKRILSKNFMPFDGSGYKPASFIVAGDKAYLHHGDHPCEMISIKQVPTGEVIGKPVPIGTSYGFVEHRGQVYDLRMWPSGSDKITRSDKGFTTDAILYEAPLGENITSMTSVGDKLLVATYRADRRTTTIRDLTNPGREYVSDGTLEFILSEEQ